MLVLPFGNFFKSKFTRPMLPFLRNSVTGSHRPTNLDSAVLAQISSRIAQYNSELTVG